VDREAASAHYWRATEQCGAGPGEALAELQAALSEDPGHVGSLILTGEIHLLYHEDLGIELEAACRTALAYLDAALRLEPMNAEAWAAESLAFLTLSDPEEALLAAEWGLSVLPYSEGSAMQAEPVRRHVAEALYDRKVSALLDLGRQSEARASLAEGLQVCAGSTYLTLLIDEFAPAIPRE
jgi:hypothetical protein